MRIKKLLPGARMPQKATDGSAGYDLYLPEDVYIRPGRQVVLLGLAMEIPRGYVGKIESRSGFASKGMEDAYQGRMDADVEEGKIDSDYREGIGVIIISREKSSFKLTAGTRIAQMIFYKVEEYEMEWAEELSKTDRPGGFGGSGTHEIKY